MYKNICNIMLMFCLLYKFQALTTAVWSVLKAKRRMLKFPNGFMAHFYAISEQMSPLMAWGFLGPDENLREICLYFKVGLYTLIYMTAV